MITITLNYDADLPGLATLTLNRPDKLNAINLAMHRDLIEACHQLNEQPGIRVVIVTGAGRAFSAGADLGPRDARGQRGLAQLTQAENPLAERLLIAGGNRSSAALESLDQGTICAINGLTIGGGLVFAVCCDIRLAAESAWFQIAEVDRQIPMTWNSQPRLMRELGPARTRELVMTCDRFSSADASAWGLVNRVVADGERMIRARELAAKLLAKNHMALALTKTTCNALANLMVPAEATHADRDLRMLMRAPSRSARQGREERC